MANTTYDPLRRDPFGNTESSTELVPAVEPGNQLSLNEDTLLKFDQQTQPRQPSDVRSTRRKREISPSIRPKTARPGTCVLHNPDFAPPPHPLNPRDKDLLGRFQFMAEKEADFSSLPNPNKVTHSGSLMSRISLKSLLTKVWKPTFWITYGHNILIFFRSKKTFEEWLYNPYLSKDERAKLIKLGIDFKRDRNLPNLRGYQATKVRTKYYKRAGMIHQFKLDRWMTYGPAVAGAFGSSDEKETYELHSIVLEILKHHPMNMDFFTNEAVLEFLGESRSNSSWGDSAVSAPGFTTAHQDGKSVASFIST